MITTVNRVVLWDGDLGSIPDLVAESVAPARLIRWAVVAVEGVRLAIEAAVWDGSASQAPEVERQLHLAGQPAATDTWPLAGQGPQPFVAVQILPTGIGLETGGYAGDGTPATNLLAAACDALVTHPNAVNAAALNWAAPNVHYVEGALLDEWLAGRAALQPVRANRIGLLVDRAVADHGGLARIENAASAFRTVGAGAIDTLLTADPLDITLSQGPSGATHGALGNPEILLAGARILCERGADAIALVADFSGLELDAAAYLAGAGPDPIGGLEAILSHLVTLALRIPCAHAPYLPPSADPCDPRAAAEELGSTFLLSVLRGLQRAPRPAGDGALKAPAVVVAPASALGGPGVLAAAARGIPIVAVYNPSALEVGAESLGIPAIPAASYLEAAGIVLALRSGLEPAVIRRPALPGGPSARNPAPPDRGVTSRGG